MSSFGMLVISSHLPTQHPASLARSVPFIEARRAACAFWAARSWALRRWACVQRRNARKTSVCVFLGEVFVMFHMHSCFWLIEFDIFWWLAFVALGRNFCVLRFVFGQLRQASDSKYFIIQRCTTVKYCQGPIPSTRSQPLKKNTGIME